ncbi:hypothetical protein DPMN_033878 [Dreissena polymorpha]|uniref:Uncharacterized protein n=1 Tax=Dreissena polymorpha TaxID=45954 RepID=A0A9D4RKB1_DREPO|nr:hypothetical protein DPMN_033878 [Dreissena polymorpha]
MGFRVQDTDYIRSIFGFMSKTQIIYLRYLVPGPKQRLSTVAIWFHFQDTDHLPSICGSMFKTLDPDQTVLLEPKWSQSPLVRTVYAAAGGVAVANDDTNFTDDNDDDDHDGSDSRGFVPHPGQHWFLSTLTRVVYRSFTPGK